MGDAPARQTAADGRKRPTKERLIQAGLRMLLRHGYNHLGIQALLDETRVPRGSFYHSFRDKEDFALQVIDAYMAEVHQALDACLNDRSKAPLHRIRAFFEMTEEKYRTEGYMGCLLGGLGQELSGISDVFRGKVAECFAAIADRLARCLEEAHRAGSIPADADPRQMADLLVDCWEGAALRCRLRRSSESLPAMLDFYFSSLCGAATGATPS